MAWANTSFNVATGGDCNCCGNAPEPNCFLTLIPPSAATYADEAAAQAALDDATQVANCLGYCPPEFGTPVSFGSTFSANAFSFSVDYGAVTGGTEFWGGINLFDNAALTFAWTGWTAGVATIYYPNGDVYETLGNTGEASPLVSSLLPVGNYQLELTVSTPPPDMPPESGTASMTANNNAEACTIRAAYDDGGGTSYLVCT